MIFILSIILLQSIVPSDTTKIETILHDGFEMEKSENYEEALLHWADHFYQLENPSPEIAREFLRVTTEHGLGDYYELASMLYVDGLQTSGFEYQPQRLQYEITTLRPLMDRRTYSEFETLLENRDPSIYRELENFWARLDPTPGSGYNARLLEHWERVAYSKANFNRNDHGVTGSDPRGDVYITYGQPDRIFKDRFKITRGQVHSISAKIDPAADPQFMGNVIMMIGLNPEYEIWIYDRPNEQMNDNLVKIFGDKPGGGFDEVNTVNDFIPTRTFTLNSERYSFTRLNGESINAGVNLTPGMIYQLLFYEQLASIDPFFARQFNDMISEWETAEVEMGKTFSTTSGRYSGKVHISKHETETQLNENLAPDQMSTHERRLPSIELDAKMYRILNRENDPAFVVNINSESSKSFIEDFSFNEDKMYDAEIEDAQVAFSYYQIIHGLEQRSEEGEIEARKRQQTNLVVDFENGEPSRSAMVIPWKPDVQKNIVFAELHNQHPETSLRFKSSFEPSLRGLGRIEIDQPEPLVTTNDRMQVSDLFVGFQLQDEIQTNRYLPFKVVNDRQIPINENLVIGFEVYNLKKNSSGVAGFQIDYELIPKRRSLFSGRNSDEFSLSLSFETGNNRFAENIEIETADLKAGEYDLNMTFTGRESEEVIVRTLELEIVNKKEISQL